MRAQIDIKALDTACVNVLQTYAKLSRADQQRFTNVIRKRFAPFFEHEIKSAIEDRKLAMQIGEKAQELVEAVANEPATEVVRFRTDESGRITGAIREKVSRNEARQRLDERVL